MSGDATATSPRRRVAEVSPSRHERDRTDSVVVKEPHRADSFDDYEDDYEDGDEDSDVVATRAERTPSPRTSELRRRMEEGECKGVIGCCCVCVNVLGLNVDCTAACVVAAREASKVMTAVAEQRNQRTSAKVDQLRERMEQMSRQLNQITGVANSLESDFQTSHQVSLIEWCVLYLDFCTIRVCSSLCSWSIGWRVPQPSRNQLRPPRANDEHGDIETIQSNRVFFRLLSTELIFSTQQHNYHDP